MWIPLWLEIASLPCTAKGAMKAQQYAAPNGSDSCYVTLMGNSDVGVRHYHSSNTCYVLCWPDKLGPLLSTGAQLWEGNSLVCLIFPGSPSITFILWSSHPRKAESEQTVTRMKWSDEQRNPHRWRAATLSQRVHWELTSSPSEHGTWHVLEKWSCNVSQLRLSFP